MSEKGRDGKYWLSSIIPGTPVFAYCDMKTGGKSKKGNLKSCSIVENAAAGVRVLAHLVLVLQSSLSSSSCYCCCSSSSSSSSPLRLCSLLFFSLEFFVLFLPIFSISLFSSSSFSISSSIYPYRSWESGGYFCLRHFPCCLFVAFFQTLMNAPLHQPFVT